MKSTFAMTPQEFVEFYERENLKFDIITFFEVLEHQDDPCSLLQSVKRILKPKGYIAGSTPNRELFRHFKKNLNYMQYNFPPDHFLWFNKCSLTYILNSSDFSDIFIKKVCYGTFFKNLLLDSIRIEAAFLGIKGVYLKQNLKKVVLENRYSQPSLTRELIFKFLKGIRNALFLSLALLLHIRLQRTNLYFQDKSLSEVYEL